MFRLPGLPPATLGSGLLRQTQGGNKRLPRQHWTVLSVGSLKEPSTAERCRYKATRPTFGGYRTQPGLKAACPIGTNIS